ncbi:F-box protein CPR1-like [Mercurialis annua]|uniref:F-box protein CPR1-like n=1 Tax=Mercurialis annua TaxID=3986 RepID=UPI00215FFA42|nr:F-box protein CPR1-like [Mercurialis annua]
MSESVAADILFTIFTLLPVKSLMRFRSLSKFSRSLIDSPEFINSYQTLPSQTNHNRKLVLADWHPEGCIFTIVIDNSPTISPLKIKRMRKPLVKTSHNFIPVNPNGVFGSFNIVFDGFGYDSVSDDYKVIMVTKLFSEDFLRVMIYSVKNNSFRRIQDLHSPEAKCCKNYEYSGVLVGSFLHWIAHPRNKGSSFCNFILAFHLSDETFREVPLLKDTIDGEWKELNMVSELGGCLSMSYCFQGYDNVWIMKEYGVEDSWAKLLTVHCGHQDRYINFSAGLKPERPYGV